MLRARWLLAGWLMLGIGLPAAAQLPARSQEIAEAMLRLPPGVVPKPGRGETLEVELPTGERPVVRLHCDLGDRLMVMLPTGGLTVVDRTHSQPTAQPFRGADEASMKHALAEAGFGHFKTVAAGPYLYVYDSSEGFYLHTRSILESMYPGVVRTLRSWGLELTRPEVPLVVVILPSREAFDAYDEMPPEVGAYYNGITNYVVLYEDQKLWEAAPELAFKQAAYTIAHEAVHQLMHNTGVQKRLSRWPMWIGEGIPEYFCPLKVNSRLIKRGDAELPDRTLKWTEPGMVNDLRMYDLLRISSRDGGVARNLVQAGELNSQEYALAWGLVHYLVSEHPDRFSAYLDDVRHLEPLGSPERELAGRGDPLFAKHFGDDFAALERGVQEHLTSQQLQAEYVDPIVNQTHYVMKRVVKQGRTFHIAMFVTTSPAAARDWKEAEEAEHKKAKFFTKICKTKREADYRVHKLQNL